MDRILGILAAKTSRVGTDRFIGGDSEKGEEEKGEECGDRINCDEAKENQEEEEEFTDDDHEARDDSEHQRTDAIREGVDQFIGVSALDPRERSSGEAFGKVYRDAGLPIG